MKKDNFDKPVYETPKVSNLDAQDEVQGQFLPCSPGSGAFGCTANGASATGFCDTGADGLLQTYCDSGGQADIGPRRPPV